MKNLTYLLPLSVACTIVTASALAEDEAETFPKPLALETEAGYLSTSGNTSTETFIARLDAKKEYTKWLHHYIFDAVNQKDAATEEGEEDRTTAEKYFTSWQTDRKLGQAYKSLFAFGSYTHDRFSGFEYQGTFAFGYADAIFKNDKTELTYNIGPGYSTYRTKPVEQDDGSFSASEKEEAFIVRVAGEYLYNFSEATFFSQTLSSDIAGDSDKNTKTRSVTALTTKLSDKFALKFSYSVDHNSEVVDGADSTDSTTAASVIFSL